MTLIKDEAFEKLYEGYDESVIEYFIMKSDKPYDGEKSHRNAVLFPKGVQDTEIYCWSHDWSEYFDDGNEWWGCMYHTVYDRAMDRFTVIAASATD